MDLWNFVGEWSLGYEAVKESVGEKKLSLSLKIKAFSFEIWCMNKLESNTENFHVSKLHFFSCQIDSILFLQITSISCWQTL